MAGKTKFCRILMTPLKNNSDTASGLIKAKKPKDEKNSHLLIWLDIYSNGC